MTTVFHQDPPRLGNQYNDDDLLQAVLRRRLPAKVLDAIEPQLRRLGGRAATDIAAHGRDAEAHPPKHVPFDAWGRRIDHIEVARGWKELEKIAAEEGIVATAYERAHGEHSRVHQIALLYLFHPSSAIYSCPLAMTDGAARAIELYGDDDLKSNAYKNLTSRDPAKFWTSGQWMTERTGGSDVGGTSTQAKPDGKGGYTLHGDKWFTSATTSQMAMTLARIEGAPEGSKGLSLFYLELRSNEGQLKNIRIHRLKDKLGTKALPTAELSLEDTPAKLVGGEGGGVRKISSLFNITRIYNAACAVGFMRRAFALSLDYSMRRQAFGKTLAEHPLHRDTLRAMDLEVRAGIQLLFHEAELLGREETNKATKEETAILRLLTPLTKLFTAKQAVAVCSEALECFGGAGYVEDTGLPALLRDAQVLTIWEGTTNVLSLDVLRAIEKENVFEPFAADLMRRLEGIKASPLAESVATVEQSLTEAGRWLQAVQADRARAEAGARRFAALLARVAAGTFLLEQAEWQLTQSLDPSNKVTHADTQARRAVEAARQWCETGEGLRFLAAPW